MNTPFHTLTLAALLGLTGCVAEIPNLPEEFQNKAPVIQVPDDTQVIEGTAHRIQLTVTDDRDPVEELTFKWNITAENDTGIKLTANDVFADIEVPWQRKGQSTAVINVSVTDKDGLETETTIELNILKQTFLIAQAEKERAGDGDLYRVGFPVANPTRLNAPIQINESISLPSLSPNGQSLAFVRSHSVNGETLVMMTSDAQERSEVADFPTDGESIHSLKWSPEGAWLGVVTQSSDAEPLYRFYLVSQDTEALLVTDGMTLLTASEVKWSTDEQHLALRNTNGELWWYAPDEATLTPVYTGAETGFNSDIQYIWHPDKPILAYTATRGPSGSKHIYLAEKAALEETPTPLSTSYGPTTTSVKQFEWSPSGRYLSYLADLVASGQDELFVFDHLALAEGQEAAQIQQRVNGELIAEGDVTDYRWEPNESRLAYLADQITDENFHVFASMLTGENNRQLTDFNAEPTRLFWDWSGGGDLVYVHSQAAFSTPYELSVFRARADQSLNYEKVGQPLFGENANLGIDRIKFSPDRSKLALQSYNASTDQHDVWLLDLATNEMVQVSELNTEESNHLYQWSPNGDGILYLTQNGSALGKRLIFQPLDTLPETQTGSLLGELAPNGSILGFQIAR